MGRNKQSTTREDRIIYWMTRGLMTNDIDIIKLMVMEAKDLLAKKKIQVIKSHKYTNDEGKEMVKSEVVVSPKISKEVFNELKAIAKKFNVKINLNTESKEEKEPEPGEEPQEETKTASDQVS